MRAGVRSPDERSDIRDKPSPHIASLMRATGITSRSRDMISVRGIQFRSRLLREEGAGKTGCALHPRSHVQLGIGKHAHEQTGSAETLRPSLRNGFTAYAALSLVTGFLTPSSPSSVSCSRT